ncbi:MAG: UDP-N-acetylmuramoyl-L-alanyl-D-glutamate--2,6-diaminopimelate ligase [Rhodocyclaceae bacterium]
MSARLEEAGRVLARLAARGLRIRRLCADSRRVVPGDLFLAQPGSRCDGRQYAAEAVARGALAVLREAGGEPVALAVPVIEVEDLRGLAGPLAHLVCGRPSERMTVVGVTGTNGKTSVCQWIARILDATGTRCAVIGTLGSGFPGCLEETANTTPGPIEVHESLARFLDAGARACAMEVSSIGLDQERVAGVAFRCAVFTNLTRDHLEYHGTMQRYGEAKARLFSMPGLRAAVLNLDDPFGRTLAARLAGSGVRCIAYTLDEKAAAGQEECFVAREVEARADGLRLRVASPAGEAVIDSRLIGRFNAYNLLAVLAASHACGIPFAAAVRAMRTLVPPEGRMQALGGSGRPLAVIDYAHTPDALEQALGALREVARARGGRLACVFGCGGDRDPGKRPQMGEVAARLADRVILASDNPRSEDPRAILEQIRAGAGPDAIVIEDRAQAIAFALAGARAADVVLIAGKGHESYQEAGGVRRPFSDACEARAALAAWGVRAA